ncbi:MAG: hypothetical protein IT572_09495 [Deltaproteobacteria bacterium]|nr:hypothetical protein [Deltaproteobacteria bacterium]
MIERRFNFPRWTWGSSKNLFYFEVDLKQPAFQFYSGDWLKDAQLSMCSPASRGVWIDALSAMHVSATSSLTGTVEQLARVCRCSVSDMQSAIDDLKSTNTANIRLHADGRVTLESRRFAREHKDRENNNLRKRKERGHGDVTPESRWMSRESHVPSSSSSSSSKKEKNKKEKRDGEPVPIRQVLARMVAEGLGQ